MKKEDKKNGLFSSTKKINKNNNSNIQNNFRNLLLIRKDLA